MISYIYIKKKKSGEAATPILAKGVAQGTIFDTYSNHRGHIMKFIKPHGVYIRKKKNLCLSNKHLIIFWVISIGHAYNFVFPIVTHD
jgi:hypothetical protein